MVCQQWKDIATLSTITPNGGVMQKATWETPLKTLLASQGLVAEMVLVQVIQTANCISLSKKSVKNSVNNNMFYRDLSQYPGHWRCWSINWHHCASFRWRKQASKATVWWCQVFCVAAMQPIFYKSKTVGIIQLTLQWWRTCWLSCAVVQWQYFSDKHVHCDS